MTKKVEKAVARQRLRSDYDQAMAASKLEIEPESVSRLENGVFAPSLERLAGSFRFFVQLPYRHFFP
ncbi:MAG: helix-turn-helix domain-containing protein [Deltaproteobacteria bacterium]|nr:helix-turn-helix domain-containing protein [Deltaproteobacteria bacterium]